MLKIAKILNDKYYTSPELAEYCVKKTEEIIGKENINLNANTPVITRKPTPEELDFFLSFGKDNSQQPHTLKRGRFLAISKSPEEIN